MRPFNFIIHNAFWLSVILWAIIITAVVWLAWGGSR
jgi:hypothetical protein